MAIANMIAQFRARRRGVVHTTLNPDGPGAVRLHLVPPKWRPFGRAPYVLILNGYYILPLGYSWAILLENFMEEIDRFAGGPLGDDDMKNVVLAAVKKTRRTYRDATDSELAQDLGDILNVLFAVVQGREPAGEIEALSLREYAPHMTAPHRMDLMVSAMTDSAGRWSCNLKCRHCYAAGQPGANAPELSTAQWKTIIDRCRKVGIPQLTFTGGEPTLRADLAELVDYAQWFVTRLNTNGVALTPELCRDLRKASLDSVQVTLYSHDPSVHNALVGVGQDGVTGDWDQTVTGLRNALAAGLDVSVNTPLCRENTDYADTLSFLSGFGVRFVSCSGLIETGKAAGETSLTRLGEEMIGGILGQAAVVCKVKDMELSFTSPGQVSPEILRRLEIPVPACGACLSNMAIAPDGNVVPCQSWLADGYALGNLLRDPWRRIWNHPTSRAIRGMSEEDALHCPLRAGTFQEGRAKQ